MAFMVVCVYVRCSFSTYIKQDFWFWVSLAKNKIEEIISKMKSYLERSEISLLEELETNDKHSSHTLN